jgi:1-acyl-sn-glycerol-3-phosphate acyltransferase
MSDIFFQTVGILPRVAFATSGNATIIGQKKMPTSGRLLLAANHISWYDIPILALHSPRTVDFLADSVFFQNPVSRWFFENMNGIRYDRSSLDSRAVREMIKRMSSGRAVVIFPEGRLCPSGESLFTGLALRPGMARLAITAQAPLLPVVLLGTERYRRFLSWMPVCRTRYGVIFGEPISPPSRQTSNREASAKRLEEEYRARMCDLRMQLLDELGEAFRETDSRK